MSENPRKLAPLGPAPAKGQPTPNPKPPPRRRPAPWVSRLSLRRFNVDPAAVARALDLNL